LTYFSSSGNPNQWQTYWGLPNKTLAIKEGQLAPPASNFATSSYWYMPGWGGQRYKGITENVSGSSWLGWFPFTPDLPGSTSPAATSSKWEIQQWNHWAVSNTFTGSIATTRHYLNGVNIGSTTYDLGSIPNTSGSVNAPLFILGSPQTIFPYDSASSGTNLYNTGSGWYIQDFRMYNGTNKNYTGSQFTPPESMIVGLKEPYPIIQP
jgi:hypothetical protein